MTMWKTEMETAEAAARIGGAVAARYFRGETTATVKNVGEDAGTYNMVTQADLDGERAIVEAIRRAFPDHAVLGEELHGGGDETAKTLASEHLWVIDPIDGTSNFVHGIPHFGVSVAYYHEGVAACGIVGNPVTDDWFTAVRGGGAFHNGRPLKVAPCGRIDEALVGFGYYYDRGALMRATLEACRDLLERNSHGVRRMGAATLDLAYVATGSFGAFFEYELSPWDFAAGRLIVEEAGGKVTTCHGDPLPLAKTSVLATNGLLHGPMVEILDRWFKRG